MEWSGAAFGVVLLALPGFRCGAFRTAPFLSLVWWSLTLSRPTASGEFFYTLFNVILAVYVDITMRAAKKNDVNSTEQYARESIRVARCARELLKRFATAYRELSDADHGPSAVEMMSSMEFTSNRAGVFTDDDIHDQIEISKELFLVVIQDRGLDIKPSFSW